MSSSLFPVMQPGILPGKTSSHRVVFRQRDETYLAQGVKIDGAKSRDPSNTTDVTTLQSGLLMGRITASGLYAPSVIGVLNGAILAGATSITVLAPVVTELVRRIGSSGTFKLTGPPSANGVVTTETVTYSAASGTTITVTATANAFVTGSLIQPTDGSETPLSFIDDLTYGGIPCVDVYGASVAVVDWPRVPKTGTVHPAALLPAWPSDTSLQRWIMARLNDVDGGQFSFDTRWV